MDRFLRLRVAMDLQVALKRHTRAMMILRDKERSKFEKLSYHDKFVSDSYARLTWCVHIKDSLKNGLLPDEMVVKYANIFCEKCGNQLISNQWQVENSKRKLYVPVQSQMLEQLVNLYCRENIDVFPFRE